MKFNLFDRVRKFLYLKDNWIDITLASINDICMTSTEVCILHNESGNRYLTGYNIQTGKFIYQSALTSDVIRIDFDQNKRVLALTSNSKIQILERFTGDIQSEIFLLPVGYEQLISTTKSGIAYDTRNYKLYIVDEISKLWVYDFSTATLTAIKQTLEDNQKEKSVSFKQNTDEVLILNLEDHKIYGIDAVSGNGTSVAELLEDITDLDFKAFAVRDNTCILLPSDDSKSIIFYDLEFREELFGIEFSDKYLNLNGINRLDVRSLVTDTSGRTVNIGELVEHKGIVPIKLLEYLVQNYSQQTVISNIGRTTENTIQEQIDHTHVKNEQFFTEDLVNKVYTLIESKPPIKNSSDLYRVGLYQTRFGHNIPVSTVLQDYQELFSTVPGQIELFTSSYIPDPPAETPFTVSYLVIDEFSFDHTHIYEDLTAITPGSYLTTYIPEFNSLELYRQGILLTRDVDYTLVDNQIQMIANIDSDKIFCQYLIPGVISNYSKHIHTMNSYFIDYQVLTQPNQRKNLLLFELPLDKKSVLVFINGLKLTQDVDYIVSGQTIQFENELTDYSVVNVTYIVSSNTIPNLLKPLDDNEGTYLELQQDEYIVFYLGEPRIIEGIELKAIITDSIPDTYIGELESEVIVFSLNNLSTANEFDEELDDWTLLETLLIDQIPVTAKISTVEQTKKSQIQSSFIGIKNNSELPIRLGNLRIFVEETEEIGVISNVSQPINLDGNALTRYSVSRPAANFVKEPTFESLTKWDLIGRCRQTYLVDTDYSKKCIECTAIGKQNVFSKAIQTVEISQFLRRALTFSVYVTAYCSRAKGDLITPGNPVPSGMFSLTITPTYLIANPDEITFVEREVDPIVLLDFPKGQYRKRRFNYTWIPEFPVVRVRVQLNCEQQAIGTAYFNDMQIQEGVLSEFSANDTLEKTIKGIFTF